MLAGPPLAAFLLARVALYVAAAAERLPYFAPLTWHRFDSGFYVGIAETGYTFGRCTLDPAHWCGNAGWFPGYPLALAPLVQVGVPPRTAGLVVSLTACLAMLVVLWVVLLDATPTPANLLALLFAAFAPGVVYMHAVFPMALAALLLIAFIALLRAERWWLAGLCGAGFATTYPTAVLIAPVTAVWLLVGDRAVERRERLRRAAITAGATVAGAVLVVLFQRSQTGAWDAYVKVQAHYDHGAVDPFSNLVDRIRPAFEGVTLTRAAPGLEAAFVAVLVLTLIAHTILRRAATDREDRLLAGFLFVFWITPLALRNVDVYRTDALLIPAALLLRRLPLFAQAAAVAGAVALSVPMAEAFLQRVLG